MSAGGQAGSTPKLARGVRLHHDRTRGAYVLLAPERVLQPDPIAVEILKRVDGETDLAAIVDDLVRTFEAPRERVDADVRAFLDGLAEKGFVEFT